MTERKSEEKIAARDRYEDAEVIVLLLPGKDYLGLKPSVDPCEKSGVLAKACQLFREPVKTPEGHDLMRIHILPCEDSLHFPAGTAWRLAKPNERMMYIKTMRIYEAEEAGLALPGSGGIIVPGGPRKAAPA